MLHESLEDNMEAERTFGEYILECPDCGAEMRLVNTSVGRFYGCVTYPECRGACSCKPDGSPAGIPGDAETRAARVEAHEWFDVLWKSGRFTRSAAYGMLQKFMHMTSDDCHMGRFNKHQCEQVMIFSKGLCKIYGLRYVGSNY